MLTTTTYSEAGGVGKTTLTANLGVAHARNGLDVLLIDMDPQEGGLSHLLDVDDDRDKDVDTLTHHLVERPQGDFDDLIRTAEHGVDVIPSHNMLTRLGDWLGTFATMNEQTHPDDDYECPTHEQLRKVLVEADVPSRYDVIMVDPPATEGPHLYNALYATRSLVIPFEPSGKGERSLGGLNALVEGFEDEIGEAVGALAAVPNNFANLNDQEEMVDRLRETGFDVPVIIGERRSMFEGCWRRRCSAYTFVEEYRDYERDYEVDTLDKFDRLADHLAKTAGLGVPA